jgi:5'-nucleotidase / UDP-sugar diphosphatase
MAARKTLIDKIRAEVEDQGGFVDTGYVDADVLKEYISKHSPLKIENFQPENNVADH